MRNDESNFIIIKHRMGNIKNDPEPLTSKTTYPVLDRHTHAEEEYPLTYRETHEILRSTERDLFQDQTFSSAQTLTHDKPTDRHWTLLQTSVIWQQQSKADQSLLQANSILCSQTVIICLDSMQSPSLCYCVENRAVQAEMTAEETWRN